EPPFGDHRARSTAPSSSLFLSPARSARAVAGANRSRKSGERRKLPERGAEMKVEIRGAPVKGRVASAAAAALLCAAKPELATVTKGETRERAHQLRRVFRPRQDDHRQELGARLRSTVLPRGVAFAAINREEPLRPGGVHARRRGRAEDGEAPRRD